MLDEPAARRRCRPGYRAPHRSHEPRDCEVAIVSQHAQPLFGREPDIDDLHAFVDEALTKGGTCVLHGDAGVGKTRLLTLCSEVATDRDARVLSASGVQFEADLSFGVLHQLLRPILTEVEALEASSAAALRSALDLGAGAETTDPVAVCTAALALLVLAARQGPVLLVVDDLQWLDTSTASVLAFIARRLAGHRIGFVGALRLGEAARFDSHGLRSQNVHPLAREDAQQLLLRQFPMLAPRTRQRIVDRAAGYPLALVEWGASLARLPEAESDAAAAALSLPRRLEESFAARIDALPAQTRRALLMLALDGRRDLRELLAVGLSIDDLAPAEAVGALVIDDATGLVDFRHPLMRSALVGSSTSSERRAIHGALAAALADRPDRRAWHLSSAAVGPDEHVARLLEQLAQRSFARGDTVGASTAIIRAAYLSPRDEDKSRRLAEAAYLGADVTGEFSQASQLLADSHIDLGGGPGSRYAVAARAQISVNGDGDYHTALKFVESAVAAGGHGWSAENRELIDTFRSWLMLCSYAGDADLWRGYFNCLQRLTPEVPAALRAESQAIGDPARTGAAARPTLISLGECHDILEPAVVLSLTLAAMYLDLVEVCRTSAWRFVQEGRNGGPARPYARSLAHLGIDEFLHGNWREAQTLADEGASVCDEYDYMNGAWYFAYIHALLAAGRGNTGRARQLVAEIGSACAPRRSWGAQRFSHQPLTLAAVADGNWEEAYQVACQLSPPGEFAPFVPQALWVAFDVVEAALRTGRDADARRHASAMTAANLPLISDRLALHTAGATAMVNDGEHWRAAFEAALQTPNAGSWPFDLARIQLAYGERLRRALDTTRAKEVLHAALQTFDRLGALPWRERVSEELRAAGDPQFRPTRAVPAALLLTPQELAIVEMAAAGLSNKEIGSRLFLSPRTVSGHLYKAFPKLGVTSRAALRDALAEPTDT